MTSCMIRIIVCLSIFSVVLFSGCEEILNPPPIDIQTNDVALDGPEDVPSVRVGLYSSFRGMAASVVIAGDLTADMLYHNGTFTQYQELGTKQITAANASAAGLWNGVYGTVYTANFILEKLPDVKGVSTADRNQLTADAHLLRGLSYFIGANTFGGIPLVTTTTVATNQNIPRASKEEVLKLVLEDYQAALGGFTAKSATPAYAGKPTVWAALARYYLYQKDWANAELYASKIIDSAGYVLPNTFEDVIAKDFTSESIFEVGYTTSDDPGTLNTLFRGRREVLPSNQLLSAMYLSEESGTRRNSVDFSSENVKGTDNGWAVRKYGPAIEGNANIVIFRLGEIYLIRAEARARQNKLTNAVADVNVLRLRAQAPNLASSNQADILLAIERERVYELAFEGHRWYDLVRTGRAKAVMSAYSSKWKDAYELWPIPQTEIQRNRALAGAQNPGY